MTDFFKDENCTGKVKEEKSHNGYHLRIFEYETGPNSWSYTRCIVTTKNGTEISADIKRNYSNFWYTFHDDERGNTYLLCGEDYQGQTVVNLTTGEKKSHVPDSAQKGHGFCWTCAMVSPDKSVLAVNGCYWACPYEVRFYDFTDPMNLPYPEIKLKNHIPEYYDNLIGWEEDEDRMVKVSNDYEFDLVTGKSFTEMSGEEYTAFDHDQDRWGFGEDVRCYPIERA